MACCSDSQPCGLGGGDCDVDQDCQGDLVCGTDNCGPPHSLVSSSADCCVGMFYQIATSAIKGFKFKLVSIVF